MTRLYTTLSTQRLTAYYAAGLLLIGGISVGSHIVERHTLEGNQGIASVINVSGRQRMLSQRIARMAMEYRMGDASARTEMVRMIPQMAQAEEVLSSPYRSGAVEGVAAQELHRLYFEGPEGLDAELRYYLEVARKVTQMGKDDPALPALLAELNAEARTPLLDKLDAVVAIHQRETEMRLGHLARLEWVLLGVMIVTLGIEAQLIFRPMIERVEAHSESLVALSNTDQLTGVANRRGFDERAAAEFARTQRYGRALSVLLLDVDHFKKVNDTHGHAAGDAVLQALARCIRTTIRPTDVLGRLGGEEFAVMLPETELKSAAALAERLRGQVSDLEIAHGGERLGVTISIGVARVLETDSRGVETALGIADGLLYKAKEAGRNRVMAG